MITYSRASRRYPPRKRALSWAPPTTTGAGIITITDDPATRTIALAAGQDVIINMPNVVSNWGDYGARDSLITVTGGRHVVLIGGHIQALPSPVTTISAIAGTSDTILTVSSTAGFPNTGQLRIDGEMVLYTGITSTAFTGCTRNYGFYNTSAISSLTHIVGAKVYLAESSRHGILFSGQTGTIHVEGLVIDGVLNDGIRIYGTSSTIVQVQNCRLGPVTNYDPLFNTDGHPDCIQILNGPSLLRTDRLTMFADHGRGILNKGSDGGLLTGRIITRDTEIIGSNYSTVGLLYNVDTATPWETWNTWAYSDGMDLTTGTPQMQRYQSPPNASVEFCPVGVAGIGYVTPGYLG